MARAFCALMLLVALAGCGLGPVPIPHPTETPEPSESPEPTPSPMPTSTAPNGIVVIPVPTAAPVVCSPSPVLVRVGQNVIVSCSAARYSGSIHGSIADPTIASVQQVNPAYAFYTITGLKAGSTTFLLSYPPGGMGAVTIAVTP